MTNRARRDGLSKLPLSIILQILGRIPLRDAIRTCVLSKEWRYIWACLPHLDFNCVGVDLKSIAKDGLMKEYTESTENFISNVLLRHKGPIHRFQINNMGNMDINIDSIKKWVLCLSRKDIRELKIYLDRSNYDYGYPAKNLKSSIYSCVKLTKLVLEFFTFHPPPSSFKGFLALKTLYLYGIEISTDQFESLVACCPLLEDLRMSDCTCSEVRICSPNLKNLYILGDHKELCLYAPLLAEMNVVGCDLLTHTQTLVCNCTNLLGCFTNLVDLTVDGSFIQYLCIGMDDSCHHTLVLHHLMFVELLYVDLANEKELSFIAGLIIGSPNLYKLTIEADKMGNRSDAPFVSFEDFGCAPNFTLENLRYVSLYDVCDYLFGMHLIKFLLESSPVLEVLDVHLVSPKATVELLGFSRSSPDARILATTSSIQD